MKKLLYLVMAMISILSFVVLLSACSAMVVGAISNEQAHDAIWDYIQSLRLVNDLRYADVVDVQIVDVGTRIRGGLSEYTYPVTAQLIKWDSSSFQDKFFVYRNTYGDWQAVAQ